MQDTDRIIGKLEEFQEWAKKEFSLIKEEFDIIHREMGVLNRFKWQVYGGAVVASGFVVALYEGLKTALKLN